MPLKLIKGETVDQILQEFNEWEKSQGERMVEDYQRRKLLDPRAPFFGLSIGNLNLTEGQWTIPTTMVSEDGKETHDTVLKIKGYFLFFVHNGQN